MKKLFIAAIIVAILGGAVYIYTAKVVFPKPEKCKVCHFITPYYKKWEASTHNKVPCLKCHEYGPTKALAGEFMFLAGAYNPRPLANVPDKNCLQSGCHDKRLVESTVLFTKRGITFDHKKHFGMMKRNIELHCSSCHSDIMQSEHLKVSLSVCFLCHFKGMPHDQAYNGCPSCHSAPQKPITVNGKTFSHDDALKAGYTCKQCHTEVTKGDGITPKDRCYFCHVDREEQYGEVDLVHEKHVVQKQVDCLWCHSKIEHGNIKMAENIPFIK